MTEEKIATGTLVIRFIISVVLAAVLGLLIIYIIRFFFPSQFSDTEIWSIAIGVSVLFWIVDTFRYIRKMRMNWEGSGEISALHIWHLGQKYTWPPPTPNFSIGVSQIGQGCCFMFGPMAGV